MARGTPFFASKAITLVCRNRQESGRFYQEVLGAVPLRTDGVCEEYRLGTFEINLLPIASERSPGTASRHAMTTLWLEVDDLGEASRHFASCNVEILQTIGDYPHGVVMLIVADPDRIPIQVTERMVQPGRFKMVRVPVPSWAPVYARGEIEFEAAGKHQDGITTAERATLLNRRADILALVDQRVEDFANNNCSTEGAHWFPVQSKLTGEFYIGRESYYKRRGESWCQVCVSARCMSRGADGPEDYLGLDVWLRFDPKDDRLSVSGADSSVI